MIDANMIDVEAWGKPPKHRSHELHDQKARKAPPTCGSHGSQAGPDTPETGSERPRWKKLMLQQSTVSSTLQRHIQASTTTLPLFQRLPKRNRWAILGKSK